MTNLDSVMTHDEAVTYFEEQILPYVKEEYEKDGVPDNPARCETWNNWTDGLCKDGQISDWQYENWSHPPSCN